MSLMNRLKFAPLAVLGATLASVLVAAPAHANLPVPGGGECATVDSWSVPAAGSYKVTWKTTCSRDVYLIEMGITVQRSGNVVASKSTACGGSGLIRSCTRSVTVNDPSGTQKFESMDEVYIRYSPYSSAGTSGKYFGVAYH